ncbi:MAG: tetratricopeptide repeat protein, partial [Anaerolineales bacterium]
FLAHSLELLAFDIRQDGAMLDNAPFQVKAPPPPPEPQIPLLPFVWYPKPAPGVSHYAPGVISAPRPPALLGAAANAAAERAMRPLLAGHGPVTIQGAGGMGKTHLLRYIATHERTRQRFRHIWYIDEPARAGQLGGILLGLSNVLAEPDPYRQLALLKNDLDDHTLLVIDNLTPQHPLLLACQTLSPFVLLGVTTPPEDLEEDEDGNVIIPEDPPGVVTLRHLPPDDAIQILETLGNLPTDRVNRPRLAEPLAQVAARVQAHPLGLTLLGHLMREDEIAPARLADYLYEGAQADLPPGPECALALVIESLPAEHRRLLEAFGAFSPRGVEIEALASVTNNLGAHTGGDLALRRALTSLRRRGLVAGDPRYNDRYTLTSGLTDYLHSQHPHTPGIALGQHARDWIAHFVSDAAYDPPALFMGEQHVRFAYDLMQQYGVNDLAARLSPTISDYLRTYIPALLPHDAPPPRLIGERAQAIQLARHGLNIGTAGDPEQGAEVLRSALAALETHGSAHDLAQGLVMQAALLEHQRDYATAIPILERAARLVYDLGAMESLSDIRLGLALAYRKVGRPKDALGVLDDRPEAEAERARIYRALGDLDNMIRAMGGSDMTPYARAESFMQAGQYVAALEAIAEDNSPASHNLRAMVYHIQGAYDEALQGYARALNTYQPTDPERAIPARAMASIYALRGDYEAAETALQDALDRLKEHPTQAGLTQALLAALHLRQGNNRTAIETGTQALDKLRGSGLHADIADTHRTVGRAAWRLERWDDARAAFLQELEHAQAAEPRDETRIGFALFHAAEAFRLLGQYDRATANLRRALTHISPETHPRPYFMTQAALHRALRLADREADALQANTEAIAHLDRFPPPDLGHLGYMLAHNVRYHQARNDHKRAYAAFARWLNTLAGRADALTDAERPVLGLLAMSLAARSLLALDRAADARPLAEMALSLADEHLRAPERVGIRWAARRDYGAALLLCDAPAEAYTVLQPILRDELRADIHTHTLVYEYAGRALHAMAQYREALEHYWTALETQPDPHQQGLLFERIAMSYLALEETWNAVENFHEAIKLLDRQNAPGDAARVLTTLAHTLAGINRYADAVGVYEDALTMLRAVPDASPLHTARVYVSLGRSNEIQGQLAQAAHAYRDALRIIEDREVKAPDDYREIMLRLARVLVAQHAYDEAIPLFERARDAAHDWGTAQEVGNITRELAEAERDGGHIARALRTYEDGLAILTGDYPPDRAALLRSYGQALARTEQFTEARKAWEEALSITQGLAPLEIALTHHAIGQAHHIQGDYNNAIDAFRAALDYHSPRTVELGATYRELGETLLDADQPTEALEALHHALEIEKGLAQQSNARLVTTLRLLGITSERLADRQTAISHYHSALVYMDRVFQPVVYAEMLRTLARLYIEGQQWQQAQKALEDALNIESGIQPRDDARMARTLRMSADAYRAEGHLEKAANAYKRMATYENLSQQDASKLRGTLDEIERYQNSLAAALDSLAVLQKTGAEPKDLIFVYALIVRMHYLLSDLDNSRTYMETLIRLLNQDDDAFSPEDERPAYRSLAHLRLALQHEKSGDAARARDHYRQALKDNSDGAIEWLIQQSMQAVI